MRAHQHLRSDRDGRSVSNAPRLAIARDLVRIYADVLHDPPPPNLLRLVERLEGRQGSLKGTITPEARLGAVEAAVD
jgi:hypothetical protein